jgi:hypothetical protein
MLNCDPRYDYEFIPMTPYSAGKGTWDKFLSRFNRVEIFLPAIDIRDDGSPDADIRAGRISKPMTLRELLDDLER